MASSKGMRDIDEFEREIELSNIDHINDFVSSSDKDASYEFKDDSREAVTQDDASADATSEGTAKSDLKGREVSAPSESKSSKDGSSGERADNSKPDSSGYIDLTGAGDAKSAVVNTQAQNMTQIHAAPKTNSPMQQKEKSDAEARTNMQTARKDVKFAIMPQFEASAKSVTAKTHIAPSRPVSRPHNEGSYISRPSISKSSPVKLIIKQSNHKEDKSMKNTSKLAAKKSIAEKRDEKRHGHKSDKLWLWIGIGVVVIVLAIVGIISVQHSQSKSGSATKEVAALVNGEPIYMQDVASQYNRMNPVMQSQYSISAVLNQSINELLLVQYAKSLGIKVTNSDINTEISSLMAQNSISSEAQLNLSLEQQNLTLSNLQAAVEQTIYIRKLINQTILDNITVSEAQIESFYNNNKSLFVVSNKVTVEHILIAVTPNRTSAEAKAIADNVLGLLNSTNFCDMVKKYSDDTGSVNSCGTYTFGPGEMVAPFENASFSMAVNQTEVVQTQYGWHIIRKLADLPGGVENLSQVEGQINSTLYNQEAEVEFEALVVSLRSKATIINYVDKTSSSTGSTTPALQDSGSSSQQNATSLPQESAGTSSGNSSEQNATLSVMDEFISCLASHGAILYGSSADNSTLGQEQLFSGSSKYLNYVECYDSANPQIESKSCSSAGISGYPTWIINGASYAGVQQLSSLAKFTGCSLPVQ